MTSETVKNLKKEVNRLEEMIRGLQSELKEKELICSTVENLDKLIESYRGKVITIGTASLATTCADLRALLLAPQSY